MRTITFPEPDVWYVTRLMQFTISNGNRLLAVVVGYVCWGCDKAFPVEHLVCRPNGRHLCSSCAFGRQ